MAKNVRDGLVVEGLVTATFPVAMALSSGSKLTREQIIEHGLAALAADPELAEVSFELVAITDPSGSLVVGSFEPDEDDEDGDRDLNTDEEEIPEVDLTNVRPLRRK